jgi:hypothetical protein
VNPEAWSQGSEESSHSERFVALLAENCSPLPIAQAGQPAVNYHAQNRSEGSYPNPFPLHLYRQAWVQALAFFPGVPFHAHGRRQNLTAHRDLDVIDKMVQR